MGELFLLADARAILPDSDYQIISSFAASEYPECSVNASQCMQQFLGLSTNPTSSGPTQARFSKDHEEHVCQQQAQAEGRSQVRAPGVDQPLRHHHIPAGVRVDLGPLPGSGATSVAKPEGNQARLHLLFLESGNALTSVPYDEA